MTTTKNLVIVESGAKAKSIRTYLNKNPNLRSYGIFDVVASFGHVTDLKKKTLSIDIDGDFKPTFEILSDKKKIVKELIAKAKQSDVVYLAQDSDNEGHAIAYHLLQILKPKKYHRIVFVEITEKALEYAVTHPSRIDQKIIDAQYTRRALDRIVGFKLSPLLWKKYSTKNITLSAGRVQSALLHLIIERERSIHQFVSTAYWHAKGDFALKIGDEVCNLTQTNLYENSTVWKFVGDVAQIENFLRKIRNKFRISDVATKILSHNPPPPYITFSLQQDASSSLGISIKQTMNIAQKLYETGHITYMRTDSFAISDEFKRDARQFIETTYGAIYYSGGKETKSIKSAQQAHECIRCTKIDIKIVDEESGLLQKLYDLIWKRTVAYLCVASVYDELSMNIRDESFKDEMFFVAIVKKVKFNGFLKIYGIENDEYDFNSYVKCLGKNKYTLSLKHIDIQQTWKSPPLRYNEGGVVKMMESVGIGRPSSYVSILQKIVEKKYVNKTNIAGVETTTENIMYVPSTPAMTKYRKQVMLGAEISKFVPTEIGYIIDDYLSDKFDYIIDKNFTSNMEADLDRVADGSKRYLDVLRGFWNIFGQDIRKNEDTSVRQALNLQQKMLTVGDTTYTIRQAKFGPVLQYEETKYIPLKAYLKTVKKDYLDIDERDIEFLQNLPKKVDKIGDICIEVALGKYGFYLKYGDRNLTLSQKVIRNFIESPEHIISREDILRAIEYKHKQSTRK